MKLWNISKGYYYCTTVTLEKKMEWLYLRSFEMIIVVFLNFLFHVILISLSLSSEIVLDFLKGCCHFVSHKVWDIIDNKIKSDSIRYSHTFYLMLLSNTMYNIRYNIL